jgi:hypothetical protein
MRYGMVFLDNKTIIICLGPLYKVLCFKHNGKTIKEIFGKTALAQYSYKKARDYVAVWFDF